MKGTLAIVKKEKAKLIKIKQHYDTIFELMDSIIYNLDNAIDHTIELEKKLKAKPKEDK